MKAITVKGILLVTAFVTVLSCCNHSDKTELSDLVNPLVGTMSKPLLSTGNTYPAIALPWGTHFWTPQTGRTGDGWSYVYTDEKIRGFKQTHQASPWMGDYGYFSLMPVTTGPIADEDARASWFSHKAETAKPYYYSVYLADHDSFVEIAPTERAAVFRITYPEREMSYMVIDGEGLEIAGNTVRGYSTANSGGVAANFHNWFVIQCDTPYAFSEVADGHAILGFPTKRGQKVGFKVASSFIDFAQAEVNLSELGDGDFDRIAAKGKARWNDILGRILVRGGTYEQRRTFYSCLYRSTLFPRDFSEITADGRRVHYSPHDGQVHDGYLFTDTGLWDTFRSLFALLYLVYPDQAEKIIEGYVNHYRESGMLPEWSSPGHRDCMIGNNSASMVAEAYFKGIPGDYETLYEALEHDAHAYTEGSASGRKGWQYYDSLGYIPCDAGIRESASSTLEYAYDDWCIAQLGKALGKDVSTYEKASGNWRNVFRKDYGLMSGRCADGSFPADFNPFKWGGDFTEGNAWHYTWSVFHDIPGLMEMMGGPEAFEAKLDSVFSLPPIFDDSYYGFTIHEIREMQIMNMGNYAHGNQPIQHMIYLYNWCGTRDKTIAHVRDVMDRLYSPAPDGYCGDEDNGQTSAWYVFSALGFYPVCPASAQYAVGAPLFDKAVITRPDGHRIVLTPGSRLLNKNFISHKELVH
ncbi:MAG: GH92 family glycosyl hydrolase [Bacteroidales bacterium]|nr:GH92 family glycosyl hydrolase [Bacteroidales bacterium]